MTILLAILAVFLIACLAAYVIASGMKVIAEENALQEEHEQWLIDD